MQLPTFPIELAHHYPCLEDEPAFDANEHLALEAGGSAVTLAELGYSEAEISRLPSGFAALGPFRVLSASGVEAMRTVARAFRSLGAVEGDPRAAYIKPRGLLYSSRFARDLAQSPELNAFLSEVAGTKLTLHAMPTVAGSLIYAPEKVEKTHQGWHLDTVGFACVIALNEPGELQGGRFQYFKGTRETVARQLGVEADDLRRSVGHLTRLPDDSIVSIRMPGAGYAMLMQGQMVLHRGEPLRTPGERMMLVLAQMSLEPDTGDPTYWPEIKRWNSPAIEEEYRHYREWRHSQACDST